MFKSQVRILANKTWFTHGSVTFKHALMLAEKSDSATPARLAAAAVHFYRSVVEGWTIGADEFEDD